MDKKYILAIDQGTSSSRAIVFNMELEIAGIEQLEFTQYYSRPGWVEQDPEEIWQSQLEVCMRLIQNLRISPEQIAALGITNQRETTIVWEKASGKAVYNAIVWQDKRTSDFCNNLKKNGYTDMIRAKTGLVIDSYFSATKIRWILENNPALRKRAEQGELCFGTVDSWLIWKLTRGKVHITDYSNASRTMLYNINTLDWDSELLDIFGIPAAMLPQVRASSTIFAHTDKDLFHGIEIPIAGVAGDQQSALFGQNCFREGMAKNTYGTGCFMLMNTGSKPVMSESGLLTTIAWGIDGKVNYALEGSVFIAGAAIKWLRDGLKLIKTAAETQDIAQNLESTEGIYVVPAFSGLGAPFWDMYARGAILGITQGVTDRHIVKATLESIAYRTKDVLDAMCKDSGIELQALNVDGGASSNDYLMQFQADILDSDVIRPKIIETTALGVALLAGIAVGLWDMDLVKKIRKTDRIFSPLMPESQRELMYKGWMKAVKRAQNWITETD
jgi:glycerol kinase